MKFPENIVVCTAGCKKNENKILKCPPSSNFISHSLQCKFVPATETWPAFEVHHNPESASGDGRSVTIVRGIKAQRSFMDGFSAHKINNPAKAVTSKGFWEHLVKGIVKDDLTHWVRSQACWSFSHMCCHMASLLHRIRQSDVILTSCMRNSMGSSTRNWR